MQEEALYVEVLLLIRLQQLASHALSVTTQDILSRRRLFLQSCQVITG